MSVSPISTSKVTVSTTAHFVAQGSSPQSKAVVLNAGSSLIFVKVCKSTDTGAVVDQDYPIPAGQSQSLSVPSTSGYGISVVGGSAGLAYVTWIQGDIEGLAAAVQAKA